MDRGVNWAAWLKRTPGGFFHFGASDIAPT